MEYEQATRLKMVFGTRNRMLPHIYGNGNSAAHSLIQPYSHGWWQFLSEYKYFSHNVQQ
jgi:hypothetical protein